MSSQDITASQMFRGITLRKPKKAQIDEVDDERETMVGPERASTLLQDSEIEN